MIHGVKITPLKQICDERGKIMHMMRNDSEMFESFGEIYFSCVYPNVVKGWHIHKRMTLNYAVPHGRIKLVLYDDRDKSPTKGQVQEIYLGPDCYNLVTIPPLVWNGFKGVGVEPAIVANCSSIPHDAEEIARKDANDPYFPYDWTLKHR
jgi:dTDP-4-dehydrorhamnose 3,5-epimerase